MTDDTTVTQLVGHNIRLARRRANLSQEALGQQLDLRREKISRWEHGHVQPSEQSLRRLATALDVSVLWFYAEHDA